jgi:hypothetical protein
MTEPFLVASFDLDANESADSIAVRIVDAALAVHYHVNGCLDAEASKIKEELSKLKFDGAWLVDPDDAEWLYTTVDYKLPLPQGFVYVDDPEGGVSWIYDVRRLTADQAQDFIETFYERGFDTNANVG